MPLLPNFVIRAVADAQEIIVQASPHLAGHLGTLISGTIVPHCSSELRTSVLTVRGLGLALKSQSRGDDAAAFRTSRGFCTGALRSDANVKSTAAYRAQSSRAVCPAAGRRRHLKPKMVALKTA